MEREGGATVESGVRPEQVQRRIGEEVEPADPFDPFDRGDTEWYAVLGED
ncbi:hypothetical protein GCM10009665_73770 [Kitasatospora nipponensis]|uniref:Uncharacterized protein n=1 Tax=Kitasatospora nipponensis TaxID=258049 RepID=A0ABP4DQD6_9ACTN